MESKKNTKFRVFRNSFLIKNQRHNYNVMMLVVILLVSLLSVNKLQAQHWDVNGNNIFNTNSGNVGVGTMVPSEKLHVSGGDLLLDNGYFLKARRSDLSNQEIFGIDGNNDMILNRGSIVNGFTSRVIIGYAGRTFDIRNGTQTVLRIDANSNMGIGVLAPTEKLEVDGTIYSTSGGFRFPDGTVQTTAAIGGMGTSQWSNVANGINYAGGRVGIGTTTPADTLDVVGSINASENYKIGGTIVLRTDDPTNLFIGDATGNNNTPGIPDSNSGRYNIFVGKDVGTSNTSGYSNTFSGYISGANNTTGNRNTFNGSYTGHNNTIGELNTFTGYQAGYNNTSGSINTFYGSWSGYNNTTGSQNTFTGYQAGYNNTTGELNTFNGFDAGYNNTVGTHNTFNGVRAGRNNTTGSNNTFDGVDAGFNNTTGERNTYIGFSAGRSSTTGSDNVFLGYNAGQAETGSNKLYIDNSGAVTPLIYGEFDNDLLRVNGRFEATDTVAAIAFVGDGSQLTGINESQWDNIVSGINYAGGRIGIGTITPMDTLDVVGSINASEAYKIGGAVVLRTDDATNLFIGDATGNNNTPGVPNSNSGRHNVFVGKDAGTSNTSGYSNTFVGYVAGSSNTVGNRNAFSGGYAGYNNTEGELNVFTGYQSGYNNTEGDINTFYGSWSGYSNTTGSQNTFIGYQSGYNNTTGILNTFNGFDAGYNNTEGTHNTFNGVRAGRNNTTGSNNTFDGVDAGFNNTTGERNTYIGFSAGRSNTTGSDNVFLGYNAGQAETGSNKLYIDNSGTATPLVYGEFDTSDLTINGDLTVTGSCSGCGSDKKLKKNIQPLTSALEKITTLNGVSYDWEENVRQAKTLPGKQIGVIAQEVEKVFPELVGTDGRGYKFVRYQKLVAPLIEAVKELNAQNKAMSSRVKDLEAQLAAVTDPMTTNVVQSPTTIQDEVLAHQLKGAVLYQNTPNPFNKNTVIRYTLPEGTEQARIIIYNMNGVQIETYYDLQGDGQVVISSRTLQAGMYLYSLIADGIEVDTKRMILTK